MSFEAHLEGLSSQQNTWTSGCHAIPSMTMAVPPEFDGPGGGASPEDLFAMSLINCFAATFKVIAQNSKLDYAELKVRGTIYPGTNEKGMWVVKSFDMSADLYQPSDPDKAKRLLEKASGMCLIINSTTVDKKFSYAIF